MKNYTINISKDIWLNSNVIKSQLLMLDLPELWILNKQIKI